MNKAELKELVKAHFNLVESIEETTTENFSSAELEDGTKVTNDMDGDFAEGQKLMVITEEGEKVSAPEGEHITKSGIQLIVDAEGVITGVKYPDAEGEGSADLAEEMPEKEEMAEEVVEEVIEEEMEDEMPKMEEILEVVGEVVTEAISEIKDEVEMMKAEMGMIKEKMSAFASEPAVEKTLPKKGFE